MEQFGRKLLHVEQIAKNCKKLQKIAKKSGKDIENAVLHHFPLFLKKMQKFGGFVTILKKCAILFTPCFSVKYHVILVDCVTRNMVH